MSATTTIQGVTNPPSSIVGQHKFLVGFLILVGMMVLFVEAAGVSEQWSHVILLLLVGVLLVEGMSYGQSLSNFTAGQPFDPSQATQTSSPQGLGGGVATSLA